MTNKKVETITGVTVNPATADEKQVATTTATTETTVTTDSKGEDNEDETGKDENKQAEKPKNKSSKGKTSKGKTDNKQDEKQVATTTATYEPVSLKKLSMSTFSIDEDKFDFNLSNVKDKQYFNRGVVYFNYASMLTQVESEQKKVDDSMNGLKSNKDYETSSEYLALKLRKDNLATLHAEINEYKNGMKFTDAEIDEFKEDSFLRLTASVLCKVDVPLPRLDSVVKALNELKIAEDEGKFTEKSTKAFQALRNELQSMAEQYDTHESDRYSASKLRVNATMTDCVYKRLYRGCRKGKDGKFTLTYNNDKVIRNEIIAQFTGRLQGSISNVD